MQYRASKGGRVRRDHVVVHGVQSDKHDCCKNELPVRSQTAENLFRAWAAAARQELLRLLKRATQKKQNRNDQAANEHRYAPTPTRHLVGREVSGNDKTKK